MIIYYILEKVHFFCAKIKKTVDNRKNIVYYTIRAQKKCVPPPTFHTFQSIHGGGFFRKEQIYEQTTRLSGYVRTDATTDGRQAKNFFAVIQQQRIR